MKLAAVFRLDLESRPAVSMPPARCCGAGRADRQLKEFEAVRLLLGNGASHDFVERHIELLW